MSSAILRHHISKEQGDFRFGTKTPCSIHVHLVEGQNLMSADANGYSDPFARLGIPSSEEQKLTSPKLTKTLDPVFDWQCTFNMKDTLCNDTLKIKLYDYDRGSRDDPLGVVNIPLADLSTLGIISGWFYLQSAKAAKKGEEVERSFGRIYVRIIGDKYCKPYEKASPEAFIQRRKQLLELVRLVETEQNNLLNQRITFETRQLLLERQRLEESQGSPPPPPPPSVLDSLQAYKNIIYATDIPLARLPEATFQCQSPCFICSPLQHPKLPAVPIDYVSALPLSQLQPLGIDTSVDEITQNDVNVPLVAYKLSLCCATWNVGNAPPSEPHLLRDWLKGDCDIYVIGTQENHYQQRKQFKSHADDWNSSILATLGSQYVLLQQEDLGEIHIHLFAKRSIKCYLDVIQSKKPTEATGFIGVLPNKGGACIAINILGTSFCFVSSHLAAHAHKAAKRDDDMRSIVKGIGFLGGYAQSSILNAFNHCFWMGDLNYRVKYAGESQEPQGDKFTEMLGMIGRQEFEPLLETDQLLWDTIEKRTAFVGFNDCPINFPPTFKVKKGDLQTYDPLRAPSYTDRVLWRSQDGYQKQVQFIGFDSTRTVLSSDHKPVAAFFNIFPSVPVTADSPCIDQVKFVITNLSIIGLSNADSIFTNTATPNANPNATSSNLLGSAAPAIEYHNIDSSVEFSSPILKDSYKTTVKKGTSMPSWTREELPSLYFRASSEGRLWESMTNILVFGGSGPTKSLIASGVLSFKSDDIVSILHHHNAAVPSPLSPNGTTIQQQQGTTPSSLLSSPSKSSMLSPSPSSPALYRMTKSSTGLQELEIDRLINLNNSSGKEAGVMKLKGYLQWTRKDRIPEYTTQQLTSIQGMKSFGK